MHGFHASADHIHRLAVYHAPGPLKNPLDFGAVRWRFGRDRRPFHLFTRENAVALDARRAKVAGAGGALGHAVTVSASVETMDYLDLFMSLSMPLPP